jgi:F420-non-reducing hydrogenase small subunit
MLRNEATDSRGCHVTIKPKLALYWAASCGGCEIAVVNLQEKLLDLDAHFDLVFCPCLVDAKKKDVEALPDRAIAITLFNGGIRTEENVEMARLLRRKSELLIAFGSCATEGCIPGLANLGSRDDIFRTAYLDGPTTVNPDGVVPRCETLVPEGRLRLPALLERLQTLRDVAAVDFFVPGCPPEPSRIWDVLELFIQGKPLPPPGSTIGAGRQAVCQECPRQKDPEKRIAGFSRTWEMVPDTERCLLDQGIVCMGIATRNGCGALCPRVNMPCTGCYGTPEGILDQGAKMVAALGSIVDVGLVKGLPEEELPGRIAELYEAIPDPAGTFYKYSLPASLLKGSRR